MTVPDIRPLARPEIELLLSWAAAEGWNPGRDDIAPFQVADPGGYFGCFIDNRMAAGISAISYDDHFGFIGLYICHPDFRGKGLGRAVWDHAMKYLGTRSIGLDGVEAQQDNYARMGFAPAYRTWRWRGRFPALPSHTPDVVTLSGEHMEAVARFDQRCFPAPRRAFLDIWCQAPHIALGILRNGSIEGYGVIRQGLDGFKIGPLFAETPADAEVLFSALASKAGDGPITIDAPEGQDVFSAHLAGLGFAKTMVTARMYKGAPPSLEERLVFGVTTLELG